MRWVNFNDALGVGKVEKREKEREKERERKERERKAHITFFAATHTKT